MVKYLDLSYLQETMQGCVIDKMLSCVFSLFGIIISRAQSIIFCPNFLAALACVQIVDAISSSIIDYKVLAPRMDSYF